jgi:hypothetical protein
VCGAVRCPRSYEITSTKTYTCQNDKLIFWRRYINSTAGRTRKRWFDVDEKQRYSEALSGGETMVYRGETGWNYMGGGGSVQG